jgi:uncharacterized protein involved in exopolysaccharide biosynthesis
MQVEAAPREPFTLGVLFRYKFTIFAVAAFVILGGYVKIVTQPLQYEATGRLAVRFTNEVLRLADLHGESPLRLPLLEEEVKAYIVQITDQNFIKEVLQDMPHEEPGAEAPPPPLADSAAQRFRAQLLKAYYDVRKALMTVADAILFTDDALINEQQQEVLRVLSKLTVSAGVEASHIITVSYQNRSATVAAQVVNAIAKRFIQQQKKQIQRKDETEFQSAIDRETQALVENKNNFYNLTTKLKSPSLEEAIRTRFDELTRLTKERELYRVTKRLLEENVIPFDRTLPLEATQLSGELEREYLHQRMRYEEMQRQVLEDPQHYTFFVGKMNDLMLERKKLAITRDRSVVEAKLQLLDQDITKLLADTTLTDLTPEYTRLMTEQTSLQARVAQAEADLVEARGFNQRLENENVSENIALWQEAAIPPFPLPQHRGLKLMVVLALGLFAGCGVALLRHHLFPKPLRRAHRRRQAEDVPLILLPDAARKPVEKETRLDISFPASEAEGDALGRESRR